MRRPLRAGPGPGRAWPSWETVWVHRRPSLSLHPATTMASRQGGKLKPLKASSPPSIASLHSSPFPPGSQEGQEGSRRGGRCLPAEEEAGGGCSQGCPRQSCQGRCARRWYQEVWQEVNPRPGHLSFLRPPSTCILSPRGSLISPSFAQLVPKASAVVQAMNAMTGLPSAATRSA
ncbi:hypothetical protein BC628DRAFT_652346 [Trametes gibbosa]|nr:hypothetical protein BC628DRAFT_652346 [Trametes gibbosa]